MSKEGRLPPKTIITCGLSFSGKSSTARLVADALRLELIGLDAINHERGLRGGEGLPVEEWERTSHLAMARLETALKAGRSVIVDDTFSHRFLRDRCREVADRCGSPFTILYMNTPIPIIDARRTRNDRMPTRHHVRDDVFAAHKAAFQHPQADEIVVRISGDADLRAWLASQDHPT